MTAVQQANRFAIAMAFCVVLAGCDDGSNGSDGMDGAAGADGANALVEASDEPAGDNCAFGGTRIDTGTDEDGDGSLSAAEITATEYLCDRQGTDFAGAVYEADPQVTSFRGLYVTDSLGNNTRKLDAPRYESGHISKIRISPDGRYVAYARIDSSALVPHRLMVASLTSNEPPVAISPEDPAHRVIVNDYDWSPDGSRLAYVADSNSDNEYELYTVLPDGTGHTRLSPTLDSGEDVLELAWSPDGEQIAFRGDLETDGVVELYVVSASGGASTRINRSLASTGGVDIFAWAPDGSRLAYTADHATQNEDHLFTVQPDGSAHVAVSDDLSTDIDVTGFIWSPDAAQLAFTADKRTDGVFELFVVDADGTDNRHVGADMPSDGDVAMLAWSPGGGHIAYGADPNVSNQFELFTVRLADDVVSSINPPLEARMDVSASYAWSPDGSQLAYIADQRTEGKEELFVADPEGGELARVNQDLSATGDVQEFRWSPEGRLVYRADMDKSVPHALYSARADGSDRMELSLPQDSGNGVDDSFDVHGF